MKKVLVLILSYCCCAMSLAAPIETVEKFVEAYNQHNVEKMLKYVTEDVKWLYNINDELITETSNKEALATAMKAHFSQRNNARSKIKESLILGNTVVAVEEAFSNDGKRSQCAISVYQMKHDLIASVTYYSATTCQ